MKGTALIVEALRRVPRLTVDGLLLPADSPAAWSEALRRLREEEGLLARLRGGVRPPVRIGETAGDLRKLYERLLQQGMLEP